MARYIDADKKIDALNSQIEVIRKLRENRPYDEEAKFIMRELICCRDEIDDTPTADVKEVIHAKWIWKELYGEVGYMLCCSNCLESEGARENAKFCSNCGAVMDAN